VRQSIRAAGSTLQSGERIVMESHDLMRLLPQPCFWVGNEQLQMCGFAGFMEGPPNIIKSSGQGRKAKYNAIRGKNITALFHLNTRLGGKTARYAT
jgi:hypothetical protein